MWRKLVLAENKTYGNGSEPNGVTVRSCLFPVTLLLHMCPEWVGKKQNFSKIH